MAAMVLAATAAIASVTDVTTAELLDVTRLTLQVGGVATAAILLPAVAMGYVLSRWRSRWRPLVQTLVALPMVLPPVAVGLLLLHVLGRDAWLGRLVESLFGAPLLLTWWAAAVAAAVMSFPLLVLGAQHGFDAVPRRLEQVAATLGASRWRTFLAITLPHAARGIGYGTLFAFARSLGEFGATSLVAGHIPGKTETLALAIYAHIEQFDDRGAFLLASVSIVIALVATGLAETLLRRRAA